jgi:hypothetical protein
VKKLLVYAKYNEEIPGDRIASTREYYPVSKKEHRYIFLMRLTASLFHLVLKN